MFMPVFSGLIVSVDSFFIGLSLGLQKGCKFIYLVIMNALLFMLCMLGFLAAEQLYGLIILDTDLIVGFAFIALGLWYLSHYFVSKHIKHRHASTGKGNTSLKAIALVGLVMSIEAMLITMGITLVFFPHSTFVIPITVALAHFGYSSLSFCIARARHAKRIPAGFSPIISGVALITYGLMAIFVEFAFF